MFNPSQADVRRFFCAANAKHQAGQPMEAIETLASLWIDEHPEYREDLSDVDAAIARNYDLTPEKTNPFLHLSMHLSITEQVSIDQPRGIRAAYEALAARVGEHEAHHGIMECLGEMIWSAQRHGTQPDTDAYVECVRKRVR